MRKEYGHNDERMFRVGHVKKMEKKTVKENDRRSRKRSQRQKNMEKYN